MYWKSTSNLVFELLTYRNEFFTFVLFVNTPKNVVNGCVVAENEADEDHHSPQFVYEFYEFIYVRNAQQPNLY